MTLKKIAVVCYAFFSSTTLLAQELATNEQQQVQQTVVNFFEALSNRDSIALKKYSTANILLLETGSIWNADSLILKAITLNTASDFKRTNRFDFIKTTVHKNSAWVSYQLYSAITRNGKFITAHWTETVVATKSRTGWKINTLHSTLIKRS
ncbi:MAG: hypothetical protein RL172_1228 [Bacteroidota bacterium]|jgi:ketosteroid isomerase-like protein